MHQKWKEMTGEFSKKSKTNTEKTYEKYGKISYVFWKNSNVFQEISNVFSGTLEILSPIWKEWLREARCEGCESKKCKIPGKARASHAREEKSLWRSEELEWKRPAISSDKIRKEIRKSQIKILVICKVNKAISTIQKEKTALFRRFLSLCLIWHPYSIEGDEIEKQQKKCS